MKITFSLISSIALSLIPIASFAQNANVSVQNSSNSATVVGTNNVITQSNSQSNIQNNIGIGSDSAPSVQQSIQQSRNEAAAIGTNNVINQNSQQRNVQNRVDLNNYTNPYFRR